MKINLPEWVEQTIYLPETVTAVPGYVRLYPFQAGILEAVADPAIERITVLKSARIGYTTILNAAIANYVVNDPSLILAYLPTDDMARSFVVSDMEPTFDASPALQGVLSTDGSKIGGKDRNRLEMRRFPGGTLKILATQSPRNMRGHNARVLIMDEVDGMDETVEGDPIPLAEMRTSQFRDRKIIVGSTPKDTETSRVIARYEKSDKRVFEIKCPHCGEWHEVLWKDIHWPEDEPEKAFWACPSCGCTVEHSEKSTLVAGGRWRITAPEVKGHAGFKINSLVSPIPTADWGKLAVEFLAKKSDPEQLKGFVNLILGEGWRTEGDELDDADLKNMAEDFGLGGAEQSAFPADVMSVTTGIDMQDDRAEVTHMGHAEDGTAYILGHDVVYGRFTDDEFWHDVDSVLKKRWRHPLGGEIGIDAAAIDSGDGKMAPYIYDFCSPRTRRKVVPIKGEDGMKRPFIERSSKKLPKGGFLWIVGGEPVKSALFDRVRNSSLLRFSKDLADVWFEQFAGERLVTKMVRGRETRRWEPISGRRNEALDCSVYAYAVFRLVTINWALRRGELSTPANDNARPAVRKIAKSTWWDDR